MMFIYNYQLIYFNFCSAYISLDKTGIPALLTKNVVVIMGISQYIITNLIRRRLVRRGFRWWVEDYCL